MKQYFHTFEVIKVNHTITMVNNKEFAKRLAEIMSYHGLSASAFADAIGVQRSSISHILSSRNKPSLDFVLKVVHTYPEVDLYWLLNGDGTFPKQSSTSPRETTSQAKSGSRPALLENTVGRKEIQKIVIFYGDGSFDVHQN